MSFRIENKYEVNYLKLHVVYEYLKKMNAKILFPPRKINSIYFDNIHLDSFYDSEEGVVPRKKMRLRYYGEKLDFSNSNLNYEVKFNLSEGRYKKILKVKNLNRILNFGIYDSMYKMCKPKVVVNYIRQYFLVNNFRVTLDKNIKYSLYNSQRNHLDLGQSIIEVKSDNLNMNNKINDLFQFKQIRYSKYSNAIKFLKIC